MASDPKDVPKLRTPRKVRDLETINAEILVIARTLFAQKTFDQVRLEDIAEKAGTSVTHIMRAFESKDGLFLKCIDQQFKLWDMMKADKNELGQYLSKYVTADLRGEEQIQHILLFIKGSLGKASKASMRKKFQEQYLDPYARWLGGENTAERAILITGFLFGVSFLHYISECEGFDSPEQKQKLVDVMAPIIQNMIDGKS